MVGFRPERAYDKAYGVVWGFQAVLQFYRVRI